MATLTLNAQLAFSLLDNQPESILYYVPVWNQDKKEKVVDFEVYYCNKEAANVARILAERLLGQKVNSMIHTDEQTRKLMFEQLLQVFQTGKPLEYNYFNSGLKKHFKILRTKVEAGVLTIVRDRTQEQLEQEEKDRQAALTHNILDTSLSAVFASQAIRDKKGKIVDLEIKRINPAFTRMTGLSEEEAVGKRYLQLFPSAIESEIFAVNRQVIETGVSARREIYYKGEQLNAWYDISLSPLGKDGLLVSFVDITNQKKAFLQLAQQKALLDNILQHSANGISVTEVIRDENGKVIDGRTILANDAAVNFTGIPRDIYLGKTATELDPNILDTTYYQLCIKTLESGEAQFTQYFLEMTKRWLEISISKMDDEHLITIFTDITPVKATQLQLEQSLTELKRSNESLEEFTRAASHDLKEPIRKVQFFSDRLKGQLEGRLSEEEKGMMERMENAAARMKLLVDDLLEYSHVNQQPTEVEEIDLNQKLKMVLMDLELMVAEKRATVHLGQLPVIKGHRRQIQQLFHNLLNNAMKYAKPGVAPVITITSREINGSDAGLTVSTADAHKRFYLIEVEDNGIGFEQAYADKIFQVFTRLHGNQEYVGTGVGLAIVRKVIENHHGYIAAESKPGIGSRFRVLLPV